MKYGGSTVGKKDGGTSIKKAMGGMTGEEDSRQTINESFSSSGGNKLQKETNKLNNTMNMELDEISEKAEKFHGDKGKGMKVDGGQKDEENDDKEWKWDDPQHTMGINASANEIIKAWEEHIRNLEKKVTRATTEVYKQMIEKKILEAQVMYKEASLHLSVDQNKRGAV
jgi:hypothetical protein